jgi:hypothetical protein
MRLFLMKIFLDKSDDGPCWLCALGGEITAAVSNPAPIINIPLQTARDLIKTPLQFIRRLLQLG